VPTFALCDANNFYASCERAFNPALEKRPVAVLSNNDGCIIARSNEVKALDIPMGAPWHQYKALCAEHGVAVFSSNYALYGDMSARVMQCLATFAPELEVYSIDEAFLLLDGFEHLDLTEYGQQIQASVRQWTGIPIGVGIGPTKTLAKLANFVAKKRTTTGVFSLCDLSVREQVLPTIPIEAIWGIGRRWAVKLNGLGITTAAELRDAEPKAIRQWLNVMGERIVYELRGEACLSLEAISPKKTIMCSRSFGRRVTNKEDLLEAITCYAARAAEKLRGQKSRCGGLHVFLQINRFQLHALHCRNSCTWSFLCPTSDSREIIRAAQQCIGSLFRAGFQYQKVGVMLMDISPDDCIQQSLLRSPDDGRSDALMTLVDQMNNQMGRGTIEFAAQGLNRDWQMRQQQRSPRYTTRLSEIVKVKC
jgi:DNA polymerase V